MGDLSRYFNWKDVTNSSIALRKQIDNQFPVALKPKAIALALKLDRVRELLGRPIFVDSWYRSLALNRYLGSKDISQHLLMEAVDFVCHDLSPLEVCRALVASGLDFDQLILEHTWVHISFKSDPSIKNRNCVLSLLEDGSYANGLTDKTGKSYD